MNGTSKGGQLILADYPDAERFNPAYMTVSTAGGMFNPFHRTPLSVGMSVLVKNNNPRLYSTVVNYLLDQSFVVRFYSFDRLWRFNVNDLYTFPLEPSDILVIF